MAKKSSKKTSKSTKRTELPIAVPSEQEKYAVAKKSLGNGRFLCEDLKGDEFQAKLRGSMQRGRGFQKVVPNNWLLVQQSEEVFYILYRYTDAEKKQLERSGELVIVDDAREECAFAFVDDVVETANGKDEEFDELDIDNI